MALLPRLALATSSHELDPSPASLALLAGLTARRWKVQHFRTRACLTTTEAVGQISGLPGRHLDAWLMPQELCRTVFARGALQADLAVVEGTLDGARPEPGRVPLDRPGDLGPIAEALDLPRVALIECRCSAGFHLPQLPPGIDAVLLDGLERPEDFEALRSLVGMILKRPVLGAIEALPAERAALRSAPRDWPIPPELSDRLAASFLRFADLGAIRALARSRPFPESPCEHRPRGGRRFRVAYAQDEAFGRYFPDTIEALEALGADLVEFSPLRDEDLPDRVDLVLIG